MSLTIKRDHLARTLKALHALTGQDVLVGIPTTRTERKEKGEPVNNAEIGYWMEFGAPAANIPARPFLIPGVQAVRPQVNDRMRKAAQAALMGDLAGVERQLTGAGTTAASSVKNLINDGIAPELSARTLAARRARGVTRTKPLVDTAQLRNSITYVIRKK